MIGERTDGFSPSITPEITLSSLALGTVLAIVFAAANAYLGLYAGTTISATIPAAVLSMGLLRGLLRRGSLLEHNIVQTFASTGESLAGGAIFTIPALVISGAWNDVPFWPTTLICMCGGLLGIVFMIPLRRSHVIAAKEMAYPEGVACAEVLKSAENGAFSAKTLYGGLGLGAFFKLLTSGVGALSASLEGAWLVGKTPLFLGLDVSPALLGVGFIVGLNLSLVILAGGLLTWTVAVPFAGHGQSISGDLVTWAWSEWKVHARYLGVGAMLSAGVASLWGVGRELVAGLRERAKTAERETDVDLPSRKRLALLICASVCIFIVYNGMVSSTSLSLLSTVGAVALSFFLVLLASHMAGLVGTTNAPVSGMVICAVLVMSGLWLLLGMVGMKAIAATLGVAAMVCCAAASGGDLSQNLKTGHLLGASPVKQEGVKCFAVIVSSLVIAPVITVLHQAYGIGTGQPGSLKAPQATLIASLAKGILGNESLPWTLILIGAGVGFVAVAADAGLKARQSRFRLPPMALAVGMYLPLNLTVPMALGGLVAELVKRRDEEGRGTLFASGLIAGEALMGVALGCAIYFRRVSLPLMASGSAAVTAASFGVLALIMIAVARSKRAA